MLTSINKLNSKNECIKELYNQQIEINNSVDDLIFKQVNILFSYILFHFNFNFSKKK
jgi:hypothetical protein